MPIALWQEIPSERETAYLLKSEVMPGRTTRPPDFSRAAVPSIHRHNRQPRYQIREALRAFPHGFGFRQFQ